MFVFIDGNIGAGKSTVLKMLSDVGYTIIPEPLDSWRNVNGLNLLDMYYTDIKKYSFIFQLFILIKYIDLIRQFEGNDNLVFVERSVGAQLHVFMKYNFDNEHVSALEYEVYKHLFNLLTLDVKGSHVYLKCDGNVCAERIVKRNRGEEKGALMGTGYIEQLGKNYDQYYETKEAVKIDANMSPDNIVEELVKIFV